MDKREFVARRVSASCAELRDQAAEAGLELLTHILNLAILEAKRHEHPPFAPPDPPSD